MEAEDSDELQELEAEEEEEEEAAAADRAAGQLGTRTEVYDEGAGSYEVGGTAGGSGVHPTHSCTLMRGVCGTLCNSCAA
jgi:hypothetical protein